MTGRIRRLAAGVAAVALVGAAAAVAGSVTGPTDPVGATSLAAAAPTACASLTGDARQDCRLDALEAAVYPTPTPTATTTPSPTTPPTATTPPAGDPFLTAARRIPGLTHAYVLDGTRRATDQVGTLHGTVKGSGVTFSDAGARFTGSGYIELPDHNDLSVSTTGGLTVVAAVTIDNWRGAGASEYVHWMGKGTSGAHEWTFRHYVDGGTGEAPQRQGRVSFYHFNPAGGLGAGSYFQDAEETTERLVVATVNTRQIQLYRDGRLRDTDLLSGYNITPRNTTTPVRIGTRDTTSGFLVGKVRQVAFYDRVLTGSEVAALAAAR